MFEISKILNFKKAISLDFDSSSKFSRDDSVLRSQNLMSATLDPGSNPGVARKILS